MPRPRKAAPDKHGHISTYVSWCCRCPDCRAAWAKYQREARARRAALRVRGSNGDLVAPPAEAA